MLGWLFKGAKWLRQRIVARPTASASEHATAVGGNAHGAVGPDSTYIHAEVVQMTSDPQLRVDLMKQLGEIRTDIQRVKAGPEETQDVVRRMMAVPAGVSAADEEPRDRQAGAYVGISSGTVARGGVVAVVVCLDAPRPGVGAHLLDVFYDHTKLRAVGAASHVMEIVAANYAYAPNVVRVTGVSGSRAFSGPTIVATIMFEAIGDALGDAQLILNVVELYGPDTQSLATGGITHGVVSIGQ